MQNKTALGVALVAVVIATVGFFNKPQVQLGANPGPTFTEAHEFLGGTTFGNVNSTSTTDTAYTMVAGDLVRNGMFVDTYIHNKTGSVATTTDTLPATSTLKQVLPKAGQRTNICFQVATTTVNGAGLTLAEGTGWNIITASTTLAVANGGTLFSHAGTIGRTILGNTTACGTIIRERAVSTSAGFVDSTSTTPGNLTLILIPNYPAQ